MVFSSVEFLLYFLPVFFILYGLTPERHKNLTLFAGSLIFYSYGEHRFLLLLLGSVLVNYYVGSYLGKKERKGTGKKRKKEIRRKKTYMLAAAVAGNVAVLLLCKGAGSLPLGISFYTFQILSYLIDVYKGTVKCETSLLRFADYIVMFPQLIQGPVVNYGEVERELRDREYRAANIQSGLKTFIIGLSAKVLLADRLGLLWQEVGVTGYESISTPLAWIAAAAYSLKLYFDFYGYSLMAVGLGEMLGFRLPSNFNMPYMARSVRDFYRRWHMTLGRWFSRYVYIPLGGNRKGRLRTVANLLAVWVLTALWHGFSPNFWLWGGLLWLFIVLERQAEGVTWLKKLKVLPHLYIWAVIPVTWVCFAVTDWGELMTYLGRMFGWRAGVNVWAGDYRAALEQYGPLFLAGIAACTPPAEKFFGRLREKWWGIAPLACLFWLCVWRLQREGSNPFMYFSF